MSVELFLLPQESQYLLNQIFNINLFFNTSRFTFALNASIFLRDSIAFSALNSWIKPRKVIIIIIARIKPASKDLMDLSVQKVNKKNETHRT